MAPSHFQYRTLCAALLVFFCSCHGRILKGEGAKITKQLTSASFNNIELGLASKTEITVNPAASPSVEVSGWENHLQHVKSKIEGNKLVIFSDLEEGWSFGKNAAIKLKITVPTLEGLNINGASDANVHGNFTGDEFRLDISGAGNVTIDSMNFKTISSVVSGAGKIVINGGTVHDANYQVNGACNIEAFPLKTTETTTTISGAGKEELTALSKLSVNINGAGKVKYKGHPQLTKEVAGAGSVSSAD